ncbi:hypothetical protein FOPG_18948 [Fusarium oxysporum f. sp. conglutinans race 2 54008]|uniref:Uncharacterized protein n=1 Tax=Fusarium oxysporum f. sp. conglutinans race 2 54008 TaxID=1089457 RepID=X0GMI0_FUSOX|nr:hypothetical protein FOPG_18948 [Fusarium oxysporum f. sp. conglutinans race 2 54008]
MRTSSLPRKMVPSRSRHWAQTIEMPKRELLHIGLLEAFHGF